MTICSVTAQYDVHTKKWLDDDQFFITSFITNDQVIISYSVQLGATDL